MVDERVEARSNSSRSRRAEDAPSRGGLRSRVERALLGAAMNLALILVERRLKRRLARQRGSGNGS